MRKFILIAMLAFGMLASCESKKQQEEPINEEQTIECMVVEEITSLDREYMFLNYGDDYLWYETCILMENLMDSDPTSNITEVVTIFQVINVEDSCADPHVVRITHTPDTCETEVLDGWWLEDFDMSKEPIQITYEEAFERAMSADCPKPHSKHCVLRKEVGPKLANPQYIFGNRECQIYVDAMTGDVSAIDPAFDND